LEMGLKPHLMTDEVVASMLEEVQRYKGQIDTSKILPRVRWAAQPKEVREIPVASAAASN